jgi:phosphate/sulfate permease
MKLAEVTNLRRSFIALGSTQMCSALIMLTVLIFALPLSSTQLVISGLTGISLIYFTSSETEVSWFFEEILMWILMPIFAMALSYVV